MACPSPGDLPNPGIKPMSLASPALAGRFFTTNTIWEAPCPPSHQFFFRKWEKSQRGGVVRIVTGRACFSLTSTLLSRGRQANDSGRRRPPAWHGAYWVGSFSCHQALCLGAHSAEDPRLLASPPSGEPETGSGRADRVGSVRTAGKNRHTGPGRRLKQGLSWA